MKQNVAFQEKTQSLESNYTEMPPRGSKYTAALQTWPNSLSSKFAYQTKSGPKKIQSLVQFLEIQLINNTSSIEYAISGVVDYKILMIW